MTFEDFYKEGIEVRHKGNLAHENKWNGLPVCPNCIRDTPCPNCPNVIPQIAEDLDIEYILPSPDGKQPPRAKSDSGHEIHLDNGRLIHQHTPSKSSNSVPIRIWIRFTNALKKVIRLEF